MKLDESLKSKLIFRKEVIENNDGYGDVKISTTYNDIYKQVVFYYSPEDNHLEKDEEMINLLTINIQIDLNVRK